MSYIAKYKYAIKKDRIFHYLKDTLIVLCLIGFTFYLLLFNADLIGSYVLDKENHLMSCLIMLVMFSGISISIDIDLYITRRYSDHVSLSHKIRPYYFITFAFMFWGSLLGVLRNFQLIVPTLMVIVLIKAGFWILGMKKVENRNPLQCKRSMKDEIREV